MGNKCCGLGEPEAENTKKGIALLNTNRPEGFHCLFSQYFSEDQELYEYKGSITVCFIYHWLEKKIIS